MHWLSYQSDSQGSTNAVDGVKPWVSIRTQGFVQGFAGQSGRLGNVVHAPRPSGNPQGMSQFCGVAVGDDQSDVGGNVFFGAQLAGQIEFRQVGDVGFFSHGSVLQCGRQGYGSGNIGGLGAFIATAQHDDQDPSSLDVVHPPAGPEVFAHLEDAVAYRLDVAKVALLGFIQSAAQAQAGDAVFDAFQPCVKVGMGFDDVHAGTVIERLHKVNGIQGRAVESGFKDALQTSLNPFHHNQQQSPPVKSTRKKRRTNPRNVSPVSLLNWNFYHSYQTPNANPPKAKRTTYSPESTAINRQERPANR